MGRNARLKRARRAVEQARGEMVRLTNPASSHFAAYIRQNGRHRGPVVEPDTATGQHLVLCGAGPTLADHAAEWCPQGDQVWACNAALPWLLEHGHRVTHGFTVDQIGAMRTRWATAPAVDYLLASSAHPGLAEQLLAAGRSVTWFHNLVDVPGQANLYRAHFPPTVVAGSGLNAVTRAIDVATFMGFDRITILGADCCIRVRSSIDGTPAPPRIGLVPETPEYDRWIRAHAVMHVNGDDPIAGGCSPLTLCGEVDGREWVLQVDMAITAQWLVRMARASRGRITLVGDHFANAIMGKGRGFLSRLPQMVDGNGNVHPMILPDHPWWRG